MYKNLRAIHLCTAMFSLVFLAVYAISAVQMTHGTWLHMTPRVTQREVALPAGITDARAASREAGSKTASRPREPRRP